MARSSLVIDPHTEWAPAARARRRLGHSIEFHESIESTNDRARELLEAGDGDGAVVLAELQTAGRGRYGRSWVSPPGRNLTLSVGLQPSVRASDAWQLGLATALGVLTASRDALGDTSIGLKWPNDLVAADGRKLGGLLIETSVSGGRVTDAVLGIGLNVNWRRHEMPVGLVDRAASMADLRGADLDRVALLDRLLDALDEEISLVEAGHSPLQRYRDACVTLGRRVTVQTPNGPEVGDAIGLDANGSLVLGTDHGHVVLSTGEVAEVREATGP